jgi:aryl-alcohol dehydrogenase-like predicted oxidoreductase
MPPCLAKAFEGHARAIDDELVKASIDAGIDFFDTADVYSAGESEATLGQSFKNLGIARKDFVLATKVYSRMGQGRNDVGASRGHIMDAIETPSKFVLKIRARIFCILWLRFRAGGSRIQSGVQALGS